LAPEHTTPPSPHWQVAPLRSKPDSLPHLLTCAGGAFGFELKVSEHKPVAKAHVCPAAHLFTELLSDVLTHKQALPLLFTPPTQSSGLGHLPGFVLSAVELSQKLSASQSTPPQSHAFVLINVPSVSAHVGVGSGGKEFEVPVPVPVCTTICAVPVPVPVMITGGGGTTLKMFAVPVPVPVWTTMSAVPVPEPVWMTAGGPVEISKAVPVPVLVCTTVSVPSPVPTPAWLPVPVPVELPVPVPLPV
jgi:hypothetical protein